MKARCLVIGFSLLALACEDKKADPPAPSSGVVSPLIPASAAPSAVVAPSPSPSPSPSVTASAEASPNRMIIGDGTEDVTFTAKEPGKDGNQTVKVKSGGTFTLFLPDRDGSSWAADAPGALGKPKEEVIPGFDRGAMGHQFKWTGLKAGKTTMTFGYRKGSAKGKGEPLQTFKITVDVT